MDVEAVFEFVADNPPMAMIVGGILLIVLSIFTEVVNMSTTEFLRTIGLLLIGLGFILQVLWLVLKYR